MKNIKDVEMLIEASLMGANKDNRFKINRATVTMNDSNIKALVKVIDYNEMTSEIHKINLDSDTNEEEIKEMADKIHIREDILRVIKSIIE